MWLGPISFLRRDPARVPEVATFADARDDAAAAEDAVKADASDQLLRELASSALLVSRGVATRVIVCNAPASIDFDEVGLIADTLDVRIDPIVRVGGGGFDFAVRRRVPAGG
jgi:hypothetical protein